MTNPHVTAAAKVVPLTLDDIDQIAEGIDEFIIEGYPDVERTWRPYIEKLKAHRALLAAAAELLAMLKAHGPKACSCRLQPFVDGPVPCPTCQVATVIAKAEVRA